MSGDCVTRERRAVDQQDPIALSSEQHSRRRAGTTRADHDRVEHVPSLRSSSRVLSPESAELFVRIPDVLQQLPLAAYFLPDDSVLQSAVLSGWAFVLKLHVPISRAALRPSRFTSSAVHLTSPICCICCRQKASIALRPFNFSAPGGSA